MKFLVIQTAFIGDVILATAIVEKLRRFYPGAHIDFLLRKGNEKLLAGHPHLRNVWVWDKKKDKYRGLWQIGVRLREEQYDWVLNCQRFAASGLLTIGSGAGQTAGFAKNPLSRLFTRRIPHQFGTSEQPIHEVERNLGLVRHLTDATLALPRLYPTPADVAASQAMRPNDMPYVCIAPSSVWFTKQYPREKWIELIRHLPSSHAVYLLGGPDDQPACADMVANAGRAQLYNLAGRLSFLESAVLMKGAAMNYVNDSAPLHIASAMDAPVAAVFCSTLPEFGFAPLSTQRWIIETRERLPCRPCGLHGRAACPKGHFACAESIDWRQFPMPE
ncbi:MAG: glycosyltransferase family 9 protein [Saprospiraceae bacterium]|nr:glycosyltransferase family 9 protein [Saprospiraceae bacterium]